MLVIDLSMTASADLPFLLLVSLKAIEGQGEAVLSDLLVAVRLHSEFKHCHPITDFFILRFVIIQWVRALSRPASTASILSGFKTK